MMVLEFLQVASQGKESGVGKVLRKISHALTKDAVRAIQGQSTCTVIS